MLLRRALTYIVFLASSVGLLFLAYRSWTGSLYFYVNPMLIPIYFVITTFLLSILIRENTTLTLTDKLLLIFLHAFTTSLLSIIVLYPGISGDNWYQLGRAMTVDIFGRHYSVFLSPEKATYLQNIIGKTYVLSRGITQSMLVVTLSRILSVELIWVHLLYMSVLWSFFVPLLTYRISKEIGAGDRTSLLASFLTANAPILIGWSSIAVPNSLGFLFFLTAIFFLLKFLSSNQKSKYILLLLITIVFSFITHDMTGITTFSLVFLVFTLKIHERMKNTSSYTASIVMLTGVVISALFLPTMAILMKYIYPIVSTFSLQKMLALDTYHIIFAEFADYTLIQALLNGTLLFLGITGMMIHKQQGKKHLLSTFLILAFIILILQHRIFYYFIQDPPFGASRLYVFMPFLAVPFAAITLVTILNSKLFTFPPPRNPHDPSKSKISKILAKFSLKKTLALLLICAGLAGLITEGVLSTWRSVAAYGAIGIMSVSSIDAVKLIHEEYLKTKEKYVVVSDPLTESSGAAIVGYQNPNELYLSFGTNRELYLKVLNENSITPLLEATTYNDASVTYLVASKWSIERYMSKSFNFHTIMNTLSQILEKVAILGTQEQEIYILRLKLPLISKQGAGPEITVLEDSQMVQRNSTYFYNIITNVTYTLTLTGHTTYNVTNWPLYWSYETISPEPLTKSINANSWINFTGATTTTYNITWIANELYKEVIWKDDAFLEGWRFYSGDTERSFTSDGDVASESLNGTTKYYVNYEKALPGLQNITKLVVRVKGTTNARLALEIWDDSGGLRTMVFWSSWKDATTDYKTYTFTVPSDRTLHRLRLFAMTKTNTLATIYWDYVMLIS